MGGLVTIGNVKTMKFAFSSTPIYMIFPIAQVLFVLLFFRLQKLEVHRLFKYSSTMIVFGWLGNFLDKLILSQDGANYLHLDYFNIGGSGNFMNISSVLVLIGWILFLAAIIIGFKDLKKIFKRKIAE